ncbi:MAG: NUMOD1 domain-containing DNA-binding protein [Spirochaetales bacterium]|jgi:hypothetical protein|nr:NUMOD1 domain-containing DNA-binding protein [Spirochaetales bacterium]
MKVCSGCGVKKLMLEFYLRDSKCRVCRNEFRLQYTRTKVGLITKIYGNQRAKSFKRREELPNYTNKELRMWVFSQPNFEALYRYWVESNYRSELAPSCDRLDDYKPYRLDNLRLVTWGVNNRRRGTDVIAGINNKKSKAVNQLDLLGNKLNNFHSLMAAERATGVSNSSISQTCQGKQVTSGGFKWQYEVNA